METVKEEREAASNLSPPSRETEGSNPSPSSDESYKPDRPDSLKTVGPLARNRKFESLPLRQKCIEKTEENGHFLKAR